MIVLPVKQNQNVRRTIEATLLFSTNRFHVVHSFVDLDK